jgi:hypothetical protein
VGLGVRARLQPCGCGDDWTSANLPLRLKSRPVSSGSLRRPLHLGPSACGSDQTKRAPLFRAPFLLFNSILFSFSFGLVRGGFSGFGFLGYCFGFFF